MSIKSDLIKKITERLGADATPEQVLEALWESGAINGYSARKYLARERVYDLAASSTMSVTSIIYDVAFEYSMSRMNIRRALG